MEEKNILIGRLKVNYKIGGKGPKILILHGWGGSSDSWVKVSKILIEKGFEVICPDFPGFGKSEPPKNPWNLNDFVFWLKKFVEKLNLEKFFLLAHSFGGRVAIKFSIFYPEKIKSLILVSPAGIKQKWGKKEKIIFFLSRLGNAIFSPKILQRFKDRARNLFYIFLRNRDYAKAKGVMRETMKKILAEDLLPEIPKIKLKTLIIWGKKDKILPIKQAFIFKEKIQNSKLKILENAGHSPHLENPQLISKIILNFLISL